MFGHYKEWGSMAAHRCGLKFECAKFHLTSHDTLRLTNVSEQLHQEKKLTKNPKRESQWLGAFVAAKLSTALFQDALVAGTINWDIVISKALSIILTSALMARSGDVAKARITLIWNVCISDISVSN